jgi:hypothetical protein
VGYISLLPTLFEVGTRDDNSFLAAVIFPWQHAEEN